MDDRILVRIPIAEVANDRLHVRVVEQVHDLGHIQIDRRSHQLAKERGRAHMRREIPLRLPMWIDDPRRQQAVGDGLRVHVGLLGLERERGCDSVADDPGTPRQPDRQLLRRRDNLRRRHHLAKPRCECGLPSPSSPPPLHADRHVMSYSRISVPVFA
jgi:hypothetical protein